MRKLKKNFNLFLLLFFIHISFVGLKKFTINDIGYNESVISYDKDFSNKTKDEKIKQLIKKERKINDIQKEKKLEIVNYKNPDFFSDFNLDETTLNLSLIPVNEKILFSGVPIPKSKPFPEQEKFSKHLILSIKSRKELKLNLDDLISDIHKKKEIFEIINHDINYKVRDNLKLSFSNINGTEQISQINIFKNNIHEINSRINEYGNFVSHYVTAPTERKIIRHKIMVYNSISSSLQNENLPKDIIKKFLNQFSFSVDFQRDINDGDILEILYEANYTKNNNLVGNPSLLYAAMNLSNQKIELFRYKLQNGKIDYFDSTGKSIRKSIMRTPISGARLSSRFGMRKHPILGYSKMHRGVDFAARRGTPIMAAGDGRITFSGRNGSYGKFIEIRHLNGFSTRYGHLHKFKKGIKKGVFVKQGDIIGYVGNTGRSTGPHLHYEVKHKNRIINPMTLRLPSRIEVVESEMPNFYANISLTRERLSTAPLNISNKFVIKN